MIYIGNCYNKIVNILRFAYSQGTYWGFSAVATFLNIVFIYLFIFFCRSDNCSRIHYVFQLAICL